MICIAEHTTMPRMSTPGERLKRLRLKAGYVDAADFARAHGIKEVTYRAHESGQNGIRPKVAERYAKLLKASAAYILIGDGKDGDLAIPPRDVIGIAAETLVEAIPEVAERSQPKPTAINARDCADIAYKAAFSILKPFSDSGALGLDPAEVARLISGLAESIAKSGTNKN